MSAIARNLKQKGAAIKYMRERAAHYGHTIRPDQLPLLNFIYVAETQEQAEQEYITHLQRFFEDYARSTPQWLAPPGYLSTSIASCMSPTCRIGKQ